MGGCHVFQEEWGAEGTGPFSHVDLSDCAWDRCMRLRKLSLSETVVCQVTRKKAGV